MSKIQIHISSISKRSSSSSYEQWATELSLIVSNQANYFIFQDNAVEPLEQLVNTYITKGKISLTPKAFALL